MIEIQSANGKFYQVDFDKGVCPCSGFKELGKCGHLRLARDLIRDKGRHFKWSILTSFEKEIMRGDQEKAILWARAYAKITGDTHAPDEHCRDLIFRYTRNLDLFEKSLKPLETGELVSLLVRSKKIWEIGHYYNFPRHMLTAFWQFKTVPMDGEERSPARTLRDYVAIVNDPVQAYVIFFFVIENGLEKILFRHLFDKAYDEENHFLMKYLELGLQNPLVALDLAVNNYSIDANEYQEKKEVKVNYIPRFENYINDITNIDMQKKLIEIWSKIKFEKPIPQSYKVDPRWSCSFMGQVWRFRCYEQFHGFNRGSFEVPWESVQINESVGEKVVELDKHLFPKFYSRLKPSASKASNNPVK